VGESAHMHGHMQPVIKTSCAICIWPSRCLFAETVALVLASPSRRSPCRASVCMHRTPRRRAAEADRRCAQNTATTRDQCRRCRCCCVLGYMRMCCDVTRPGQDRQSVRGATGHEKEARQIFPGASARARARRDAIHSDGSKTGASRNAPRRRRPRPRVQD
jgi:hypothetical protein